MSAESAEIARHTFTDRYPGIRPFKKMESALFFGRDVEIEELLHSVKVHDTLVIYSKSGLGKSSLVNAGLAPRLVEEKLLPIDIRFLTNADKDPFQKILSEVKATMPREALATVPEGLQDDLWVLFNHWQSAGTPVLIFDQFEEFFYYDQNLQAETISRMANLINGKVTEDVIKQLAASEPDNKSLVLHLLKKPAVKILFLIRSDRLSLLEVFSAKLPQILNNRYHLKPLRLENAEQAISLPAQLTESEDVAFKTRAYEYSIASLRVILRSLGDKKNGEIESSQLQIVCQELEKIAEAKWNLTQQEITMEPEDFGAEKGIQKIIDDFYWNQLEKLKTNEKLQLTEKDIGVVRNLIEKELLSGNKRIIQSVDRVKEILRNVKPETAKVGDIAKEDFLADELLNLRLIREEDSHLGKVFEISHDTLVESIAKAREERIKEEQAALLQQQQAQLEKERQRTADEMRLKENAEAEKTKAQEAERSALQAKAEAEEARLVALKQEKKAKKEKENAEREKLKAQEAERLATAARNKALRARRNLRVALLFMLLLLVGVVGLLIHANNSRIDNKLKSIEESIRNEDYDTARAQLRREYPAKGVRWLINYTAQDTFAALRNKIEEKARLKARYDSLIEKAAEYKTVTGESLQQAFAVYQQADALQYIPQDPDKRLTSYFRQLKTEINTAFNRYVDKAEAFQAAGETAEAKDALTTALRLRVGQLVDSTGQHFKKFEDLKKSLLGK